MNAPDYDVIECRLCHRTFAADDIAEDGLCFRCAEILELGYGEYQRTQRQVGGL